MKKIKQFNFLEWNNHVLASSMKKIDLSIFLAIVLDALFYLLSGYLAIFWLQRIQAKLAGFNLPSDVTAIGVEKTQQLVADAKAFYFLLIFSFLLLLTAIIFLASVLKGIIWARTTKTKISFALISKFLGLNLIWMGFWFAAVFLVSWLAEPAMVLILMAILAILGLYFTNALYTIFMKEQKISSIIRAVKLGVTKVHLFLLPYAVILLLFFVIVSIIRFVNTGYPQILAGLAIIAYFAAVRYYTSTLALEAEKAG